ncbi:hypothetical protein [Pseudogracilibacillus sp. SO30301A]|uniref:hypothetical protein n=1 Tax=Pseudogracilibacillus sp. SO30301A TaxID=3098291 RepID=UPI00300E6861
MKINKSLILVLMCVLLLFACENNSGKGGTQVTYRIGFPEEISPALMEFLISYSTPMYTDLFKDGDKYIYSKFNIKKTPEEIEYYTNTEEQAIKYFTPLINTDNPKNTFIDLTKKFEAEMLKTKENELVHFYPEAILEDNNTITIQTIEGEKSINLVEELAAFDLQQTDELVVSIPAANEQSFFLKINNAHAEEVNQYIYVYMNQDFTNYTAVSGNIELFNESINKGKLDSFKELVFETELNDQYTVLTDRNRVVDKKNKIIHRLNGETGFPSQDGKYIILQGKDEPLAEGVHRIQRTEDYLEENEQYYAEFELNYEEISNELDFKSVGIGLADIVYFNEDFVILYLNFKAAITGTAGSTNVIVDFQEDRENPTIYLVDLGLH